jgi:FkbM family methyltransferase
LALRSILSPKGVSRLLDQDHDAVRVVLQRRYSALEDVLIAKRDAVVYPAARLGRKVAAKLVEAAAQVVAMGDRDPDAHGGFVDGRPVLTAAEIASRHPDAAILVASAMHDSAIREALEAQGCQRVVPVGYLNLRLPHIVQLREFAGGRDAIIDPANRADIEAGYEILADDESRAVFQAKLQYFLTLDKTMIDEVRSGNPIYFDATVYNLSHAEVVADGGAFVGDTLQSFLRESNGHFRRYVAFEPDPASRSRLALVAARHGGGVDVVAAGLGARSSRARLLSTHGADARVLRDDESGGDEIAIVSLDEYFTDRPAPTLIKMDIEGAEHDALLGAARTIKASGPKLAISAYHTPTDLWRIPVLLKRLMPRCRLFLRHYTREIDDTVCYAIPD